MKLVTVIVRPVSMATSVSHVQLDLNLEKQSAFSVQAMNISRVTHVSRAVMSAKDAVVGLISALTALLIQNYRLDSVSAKIASIKARTVFASRVTAPVQHVSARINVRHAQRISFLEILSV